MVQQQGDGLTGGRIDSLRLRPSTAQAASGLGKTSPTTLLVSSSPSASALMPYASLVGTCGWT